MKTASLLVGIVATAGLLLAMGVPSTATVAGDPPPQQKRPARKVAAPAGAPAAQAPAQPPAAATPGADRPDDRAAIAALNEAFTKAFNQGDAAAVARQFTPDAQVIDEDGSAAVGTKEIEARFTDAFTGNPKATIKLATDSLRFVAPDAALEEGVATVTDAGGAVEISPYSVVYVKRDGRWLHANVRDHPAQPPSPHDRLKDLAWLVGDWMSESQEALVVSHCEWADNGSFLLRSFTVKVAGKATLSGTERIGWDPLTKHFKSWVFDTEGGYGEGIWTRGDENAWVMKATGVRADGKVASATRIITVESPHRSTWQVVDRTLDGAAAPDPAQFVMVLQPPKRGK